MIKQITTPYNVFHDIDGSPLESGYIYIGVANLNPETNPIAVFWDSNLTVPAALPVRTIGGYPSNTGTAGNLFCASDYSCTIKNKRGTTIYSSASVSILQPNSSPMSVLEFGAVGDGVTNDHTAISNAIAAAALAKRTLLFPAGYIFASASKINVPSNSHFTGGGTIKALPLGVGSGTEGFINGDGITQVTIEDITIDCSPATQSHQQLAAIYFTTATDIKLLRNKAVCSYAGLWVRTNSSDVIVDKNYIDNSYGSSTDAALRKGASIIVGASNATITNNHTVGVMSTAVTDSDIASGIYFGAETAVTYTNGVISGNIIRNTYTAISVRNVKRFSVTGNNISDCRTAGYSQGVYITDSEYGTVTGNVINNVDHCGVASTNSKNVVISGNMFSSDATFKVGETSGTCGGVLISGTDVTGDSRHFVVSNNIFIVPDGGLTATGSPAWTGVAAYGDNIIIEGNTILAEYDYATDGIVVGGEAINIANNIVKVTHIGIKLTDTGYTGAWSATTNARVEDNYVKCFNPTTHVLDPALYHIYDSSAAGGHIISGNMFFDGAEYMVGHNYTQKGNFLETHVAKTADYTLTIADSQKRFTNAGAAGTIVFTLPTCVGSSGYIPYGTTYRFFRSTSQAIRIDPDGTEVIGTGGAGKYIELDSDLTELELTAMNSGYWRITNLYGTVAYEP